MTTQYSQTNTTSTNRRFFHKQTHASKRTLMLLTPVLCLFSSIAMANPSATSPPATSPQAASAVATCPASIPKPNLQSLDKTSEDAVAQAFMQAIAHQDLDSAIALIDLDLMDMPEDSARRYTQSQLQPLMNTIENIGKVHSFQLSNKTRSTEVYLPGILGIDLPVVSYDVSLTFCVKSTTPKKRQPRLPRP